MRPGEELYDLEKDPECIVNLALFPEFNLRMLSVDMTNIDKVNESDFEDTRVY